MQLLVDHSACLLLGRTVGSSISSSSSSSSYRRRHHRPSSTELRADTTSAAAWWWWITLSAVAAAAVGSPRPWQRPRMVMCVHTHILTRAFLPRHDQRGESPRSISRSDCLDSSAKARAPEQCAQRKQQKAFYYTTAAASKRYTAQPSGNQTNGWQAKWYYHQQFERARFAKFPHR